MLARGDDQDPPGKRCGRGSTGAFLQHQWVCVCGDVRRCAGIRVCDLFSQATGRAPRIIFIDELDALGKAREMNVLGGNDERGQTLNKLPLKLDGFNQTKGL